MRRPIPTGAKWRPGPQIERLITLLERRRGTQLVAVLTVSIGIGAFTAHLVGSARAAREQWATEIPALLAVRSIGADEEIDAGAVISVSLPRALAAEDALSALPSGARLAVDVAPRTVITDGLLAKDVAVVPEGWRTVAIPDDVVAPPLSVGQSVDVVANGLSLAEGAVVASLDPLTVAVDPGAAAVVAAASRTGDVSLVAGG
ncbi:MAG: hypothetical protein ACKOCC_00870 [Actinomycetota bacterium]